MIYKEYGLTLTIKWRYRKGNREYEDDFARGSSSFWLLMQQKFPRMSDGHASQIIKTRKKVAKTNHV